MFNDEGSVPSERNVPPVSSSEEQQRTSLGPVYTEMTHAPQHYDMIAPVVNRVELTVDVADPTFEKW